MLVGCSNSDLSQWPDMLFVQLSSFSNQNVQMLLVLEPRASAQCSCKAWVCFSCKQQEINQLLLQLQTDRLSSVECSVQEGVTLVRICISSCMLARRRMLSFKSFMVFVCVWSYVCSQLYFLCSVLAISFSAVCVSPDVTGGQSLYCYSA